MADRALLIVGRALLYWLGMFAAIFCLGALRESLLRPVIGELPAHQVGSVAAIVVIALFARRFVSRTMVSPGRAVFVGAFWVALTASFEVGFFRFIVGLPWDVLTADYNLAKGRLMGVLMLVTFVAPWAYAVLFWGTVGSRTPLRSRLSGPSRFVLDEEERDGGFTVF